MGVQRAAFARASRQENEEARRGLTSIPSKNGHSLKFASDDRTAKSSDIINVENRGSKIWFLLVHLGRKRDDEINPDSHDGIANAGAEKRGEKWPPASSAREPTQGSQRSGISGLPSELAFFR
ncbi:MAG: hypothetical protein M1835_002517 [Candelina submexicana]|nr:MAG: hypothetical protein M1835_002517 [Candelina submexicana]